MSYIKYFFYSDLQSYVSKEFHPLGIFHITIGVPSLLQNK